MSSAYFPPGTDIGGFVIEIFLKQNYLGHSYLASDRNGEKYTLTVLNSPADFALQNDLAAWAETLNPVIYSDIRFYSEPVQMIVSPCCKGLTLEEEGLAGTVLSPEEAANILRETAAARTDLVRSGASDCFISPESILITPSGRLVIQRDHLHYGNFANTYKQLVNACFALVTLPPDVSVEELKQQFLANPEKELTVRKASSAGLFLLRHKKKIAAFSAFFIFSAALISAAVILANRQKSEKTENTIQTLTATHHSRGPVVHEAPRQKQKTSPAPIPAPAGTHHIPQTPPRPKVRKTVPVKAAAKKVVKPVVRPATKPVAPVAPVANAAKRGSLLDLKILLAGKADVNAPDADGKTAMFYAASANWKAMIQLLHNAGAKITPGDINAASREAIRRYMRSLLAPPRPVPRAVNSAPRPATRSMLPPRINGWKRGEKNWNITLEHAIFKARPARKKILVLFTGADWCGPCQMLEKNVLSSGDFRRLTKQMELVCINFPKKEKMPQAQKLYNEKLRRDLGAGGGVPTVLILDHNGKQIGRIGGYRPKDRYISELQKLLRK